MIAFVTLTISAAVGGDFYCLPPLWVLEKKESIPLTHEMAATVWHRGTLVEMPGGEVVLSE